MPCSHSLNNIAALPTSPLNVAAKCGGLPTLARETVGPRVIPDVGAVATETSELHVIRVRFLPVAKHENEFMP